MMYRYTIGKTPPKLKLSLKSSKKRAKPTSRTTLPNQIIAIEKKIFENDRSAVDRRSYYNRVIKRLQQLYAQTRINQNMPLQYVFGAILLKVYQKYRTRYGENSPTFTRLDMLNLLSEVEQLKLIVDATADFGISGESMWDNVSDTESDVSFLLGHNSDTESQSLLPNASQLYPNQSSTYAYRWHNQSPRLQPEQSNFKRNTVFTRSISDAAPPPSRFSNTNLRVSSSMKPLGARAGWYTNSQGSSVKSSTTMSDVSRKKKKKTRRAALFDCFLRPCRKLRARSMTDVDMFDKSASSKSWLNQVE